MFFQRITDFSPQLWYLGIFLVGLGSAAFHGTLLYEHQMWDELPMMWATFSWLYIVWEISSPLGKTNVPLAVAMFLYAVFVTVVHVASGFVLVFQIHFIALMWIGQGTVIYWTRKYPHPEARKLLPAYFGSILVASAGWVRVENRSDTPRWGSTKISLCHRSLLINSYATILMHISQ